MDLKKLREEIDSLDDEIVSLYCKRMQLSRQIGEKKLESGQPVNVPQREQEIVSRLTDKLSEEMQQCVKQLYDTIFFTSKTLQKSLSQKTSPTCRAVEVAFEASRHSLPQNQTVACQGVDGSFSSIAADRLFDNAQITFFKSFDGVFNAIDKGLCRYGVLPLENSNSGSVLQVYNLMRKYRFYIVKSALVAVDHVLAAKPAADLADIKKVLSQEQALMQCEQFVKNIGAEPVAVANTAVAARTVAECDDNSCAAICSEKSAKIYGLKVLKRGVQDNGNNHTRFIGISKDLEIFDGANKISFMISTANKPGSLNKVLARFAALNLNLTKLESRPVPNSDFEFLFYFDFEGNINDPKVMSLIAELESECDKFVFLGSYGEVV